MKERFQNWIDQIWERSSNRSNLYVCAGCVLLAELSYHCLHREDFSKITIVVHMEMLEDDIGWIHQILTLQWLQGGQIFRQKQW